MSNLRIIWGHSGRIHFLGTEVLASRILLKRKRFQTIGSWSQIISRHTSCDRRGHLRSNNILYSKGKYIPRILIPFPPLNVSWSAIIKMLNHNYKFSRVISSLENISIRVYQNFADTSLKKLSKSVKNSDSVTLIRTWLSPSSWPNWSPMSVSAELWRVPWKPFFCPVGAGNEIG